MERYSSSELEEHYREVMKLEDRNDILEKIKDKDQYWMSLSGMNKLYGKVTGKNKEFSSRGLCFNELLNILNAYNNLRLL